MYQISQLITRLEKNLRAALKNAARYRIGYQANDEIRFRRIHFVKEFGLVTFEIDRNKYPFLTESFFETGEVKSIFQSQHGIQNVDVMDLGKYIIFYFWLAPVEQDPPIKLMSLVYS